MKPENLGNLRGIKSISNIVINQLSDDLGEEIIQVPVCNIVVGLKKESRREYKQVFIIGGDNKDIFLFSTDQKYQSELSNIAEQYGLHYAQKDPAPIEFLSPNSCYAIEMDPFWDFKRHINNYFAKNYSQILYPNKSGAEKCVDWFQQN